MNTVQSFPANWSELPGDLLALIIEKLVPICSLSDYVRFGAVCRSWRFFFSTENYEHIKLSTRLPVLLIPSTLHIEDDDNININKSTRSFYSLSEKKVYNFQLPVPYYKNCLGSSHGWLVTVEEDRHSVKLLNPFRSFNNEIQLPPLPTCEDVEDIIPSLLMSKAVLSANPWPSTSSKPAEDVVVMGIYCSNRLRYCRPGDKAWTSVPCTWVRKFHDVIYYKGQFYATKQTGSVVAFDVAHHLQEPKVTAIAQRAKPNRENQQIYLVECSGHLFQVYRASYYNEETYWTIQEFEVYKLIPGGGSNHKWVRVRDLNGCSLFLGINASMSVNAADFPGCKPDCIYFTYKRFDPSIGSQNMGVFCLVDQSFETLYSERNITMPAPIWIQPTL